MRKQNRELPCRGSPQTQLLGRGDYRCVSVCVCVCVCHVVGMCGKAAETPRCWNLHMASLGIFFTLHQSQYGRMADVLAPVVLVGNSTPATRQGAAISPAPVKNSSCRRDEAIRNKSDNNMSCGLACEQASFSRGVLRLYGTSASGKSIALGAE